VAPPGHREPSSIDLSGGPGGSDTCTARVWPLQLEARPQPLADADYVALTSLFATATEDYDIAPADPPYDSWTWPPDLADPDELPADLAGDTDPLLTDPLVTDPELADPLLTDPLLTDPLLTADEAVQVGPDWAQPPDWATDLGWDADPEWAAGPEWATSSPEWVTGDPQRASEPEPASQPEAASQPEEATQPEEAAQPEPTADVMQPEAAPLHEATLVDGAPPEAIVLGALDPDSAARNAAPEPPAHPNPEPEPGPPGLRIGVLGAFTINGQPGALLPAQSQLVLALALNGASGLSNQQLCYLLGADPDRPKPSDSLRQLIVRTRRQLGRAPDRREWIEHLGGGQYALHPDARFDWQEFDQLTTEGMRSRDAQKLRRALGLIRGRPFTGCYYWWLDLATTESIRAQIVDAADVLAALEIAAGDPAAAARAARIGLTGDVGAEQLWRALMRAEHAAGNLSGVREAWNRCLDAISEIAPDGEPHPGTAALYRELLGGSRARPAWAGG
jgi:DNA-binding SARP family transcriptional activator